MIDTFWGIKYEKSTKHTHIYPVSAESQILGDFKIGGISPYYLSLSPGSAIIRNYVFHREELLCD
jgi:hypothetical protein